MPNCHQCNQNAGTNARDGECTICFSTGVTFCPTCAMWELGPKTTTEDMFAAIATSPRPKKLSVPRQHSEESSDSTGSLAELPLDCKAFLPMIGDACPFIKEQLVEGVKGPGPFSDDEPNRDKDDEWWAWVDERTKHADTEDIQAKLHTKSFGTYACEALDKFRALYPACKYDRVAIQVMLFMYLSAQERVQCRFMADASPASARSEVKYLKRWQIRTVALAHLKHHVDDIGKEFGSEVKQLISKPTWQAALGLDQFELFMKGFMTPALLAIELMRIGGGTDAAREILEISVILYHTLTTARAKAERDEHWSQTASTFKPGEALAFLSKQHYQALYETDEASAADQPKFCQDVLDKLNQLWNVLGDTHPGNTLCAHPRFPDRTVPGSLDTVEKNYLQYLPVFDHPETEADQRSECEAHVRARIVDMVKEYRPAYISALQAVSVATFIYQKEFRAKSGTSKYVYIEAPDLTKVTIKFTKKTGATYVQTDLEASETTKIDDFLKAIEKASYLKAHKDFLKITVSYEKGPSGTSTADLATTKRRTDRRDAVVALIEAALESDQNPNIPRTWLEYIPDNTFVTEEGEIIEDWDPVAYTDAMISHMQNDLHVDQCFDDYLAKLLLTTTTVVPKAWFPLKLKEKKYEEVFPDCKFASDPKLDVLDEHYNTIGGSSARPAHYVDWRNHKDVWLYDCFPIDPRRRPLFCSLSLQPIVPEPNSNYGKHTMLFKRSTTKHRSVHTFGDKQQPRRSMLLLLDDIFYAHTKKDGDEGQTAAGRVKIADDLFRRIENMATYRTKPLTEQWDATVAGAPISYPDGDRLIECQIFGPVVPSTDLLGLIIWVAEEDWIKSKELVGKATYVKPTEVVTKQLHLTTHYGGTLLAYKPNKHNIKFAPKGSRPEAQKLEESKRRKLLDKQPY